MSCIAFPMYYLQALISCIFFVCSYVDVLFPFGLSSCMSSITNQQVYSDLALLLLCTFFFFLGYKVLPGSKEVERLHMFSVYPSNHCHLKQGKQSS